MSRGYGGFWSSLSSSLYRLMLSDKESSEGEPEIYRINAYKFGKVW